MTTLAAIAASRVSEAALRPVFLLRPIVLLRAEAAAALVCGVLAFAYLGHSWWLFVGLFLVPDLAIAGYLKGPRVGAAIYNAAHLTVIPAALGLVAAGLGETLPAALAAIWVAHIGLDRLLGIGLKLPSGFADTHLGNVGRTKA